MENQAQPRSSGQDQLAINFNGGSYDSSLARVHGGELYYSQKLLEQFGVSPMTLKTRRSENKKNVSTNYEFEVFICDDGQSSFFYKASKIPLRLFAKYGLPSVEEVAKSFSLDFQMRLKIKLAPLDERQPAIAADIDSALDRAFLYECRFYRNEFFANESQNLARKYAILVCIVDHLACPKPVTIKAIHSILIQPKFRPLKFPLGMPAFYSYLDRARESKDLVAFTKGKWNVADNARKVNDAVADLICYYAGHPNRLTANKILALVNSMLTAFPNLNGKKILEIRTIEQWIVEHKPKVRIFQEGEEYARKRVAAYLHMHSALNPFDQFFMDEWWIEFVCNKSNRRLRKILVGMMDGRSKKMVNHKKVLGLNKAVIKDFLYDTAVASRDRWPAELVNDFASYNVCEDIRRMMNYLVYTRKDREKKFAWTTTSDANRKTDIERFWETYGSYFLSPHVGATGRGLTAERDNACPAKIIEIFIEDPAFLDDESEVDRCVDHFLAMYNKKGLHFELPSPNEVFRDNEAKNAIKLEPVDFAFMWGEKESRRFNRSEVLVAGRHYQILDSSDVTEALVNCQDRQVDIYSHHRYPDCVFLFVENTMDFVCELKHYDKNPKAKINQTQATQEKFGSLYEAREKGVAGLLGLKSKALENIKKQTSGVNPGEVALGLIDTARPKKATSVSHLNPNAPEKIELDPFGLTKEMKPDLKAGKKREKKPVPVPAKGLLKDNLTERFG